MRSTILAIASLALVGSALAKPVKRDVELLTDINVIQRYWGQVSSCFSRLASTSFILL